MAHLVTGKVRLSYEHIWEPASINDSDEKYSVSLIIPKSDTKTVKDIQNAVEQAKQDGKAKFGGRIPANLKLPLRDGDIERPDDEAYKDCYFINCNSKDKPQIVDKNVQPILDRNEVYSGCYASQYLFIRLIQTEIKELHADWAIYRRLQTENRLADVPEQRTILKHMTRMMIS